MTLLAPLAQQWMDNDHMDGWGWVMMAFVLLLIVAIIAVLIYALTRDSRGAARATRDPSAIDVLDHRFARGEIDDEEYRTRRDMLSGS